MTETIKLFMGHDAWYMQTDSERTKALFGTDTLPTSFTRRAPPEMVLKAIRARNPQAEVNFSSVIAHWA